MHAMDALQQLQLDVMSRLTADTNFQFVQTVNARPRSEEDAVLIQTKIDQALAGMVRYIARTAGQTDAEWEAACEASGKSGLCIAVLMPEVELPQTGLPGPALIEVVMTVRVTENPLINMDDANGTKITAEDGAVKVLQALHHWSPNGSQSFVGDKKPLRPLEGEGKVIYDVVTRMMLPLAIPEKCANPVITISGNNVEIACATSGAAIYYTTNGTLPTPTSGTLYSDNFEPGDVTLIRAVATKSGLATSDTAQKPFTLIVLP